jgi:hypothetical protein
VRRTALLRVEAGGSLPVWLPKDGLPAPKKREPLAKEIVKSLGMKLMLIPAGKFLMGAPQSEAAS